MCGIAGFVDFSGFSDQNILENMTGSLNHRGPDGTGCDLVTLPEAKVGLGHKRLSILDLSQLGRQPMYDQSENFGLIFNGEVYNFKEVRKWLVSEGHQFKSESDTEVILYALIREGVKAVSRFRGMFSIVFLDKVKQKALLIRDRVGVKPLYYTASDEHLLFASELRAFFQHPKFNKEIDIAALGQYLDYGYVNGGNSIFKSVKSVTPGTVLEIDLHSKTTKSIKYWSHLDSFNQPNTTITYAEALEELEPLLIESFKLRMVSDVPVGVFMSGGIDSTTVAAILQQHYGNISTFTIGFENKAFDESGKARAIAEHLGTHHHEMYCSEKELLQIFSRLPDVYDEPFADKSAIPSILVSEFAKPDVTVALSADGGDEVFGGYNKYFQTLRLLEQQQKSSSTRLKKQLYKLLYHQGHKLGGYQNKFYLKAFSEYKYLSAHPNGIKTMLAGNLTFGSQDLSKLIRGYDETKPEGLSMDQFAQFDELSKLQAFDYQDYLPYDILVKMDRASMSIGLESREPLLDHKIAEFAARLPANFHSSGGVNKRLLRDINKKYIPENLISVEKKGFAIPKKKWLSDHLKPYVHDYLEPGFIKSTGLFSEHYVSDLLKAYNSGKGHNRVWNLLIFNMWYERWMK